MIQSAMDKEPKVKDVAGLVKAAQMAGAGTDDGFWEDVAGHLDAKDDAKKIRVEERLTVRKD